MNVTLALLQGYARSVRRFLSVRHRTAGAAVLRVALALNMLVLYVMHFPERQFIWGDNGALSLGLARTLAHQTRSWSLYLVGNSPAFHALCFWAGFLVTILFCVGVAPRIMSVLFFIASWSLYVRNPMLMDGGDNILILIAFLMIFIDTSGAFAPWQRNARPQNPFVALVHNAGVVAILLQICILYFTSAWAKMSGHTWQDGTALYYILRTSSFGVSPLDAIIIHNSTLETLLTYATILFQIGFPFVIWNRYLKYPWLAGAFMFHLGIGVCMGLMWFSFVMISCETIFIGDRTYTRLRELSTRILASAAQRTKLRLRRIRYAVPDTQGVR